MAENSDLTSNIFNFFYDPNLIINIPDKPVGWEKPVAVSSFTSDTAPVKKVIQNNFNGILVDFYDIDLLVKNVNLILNNP